MMCLYLCLLVIQKICSIGGRNIFKKRKNYGKKSKFIHLHYKKIRIQSFLRSKKIRKGSYLSLGNGKNKKQPLLFLIKKTTKNELLINNPNF